MAACSLTCRKPPSCHTLKLQLIYSLATSAAAMSAKGPIWVVCKLQAMAAMGRRLYPRCLQLLLTGTCSCSTEHTWWPRGSLGHINRTTNCWAQCVLVITAPSLSFQQRWCSALGTHSAGAGKRILLSRGVLLLQVQRPLHAPLSMLIGGLQGCDRCTATMPSCRKKPALSWALQTAVQARAAIGRRAASAGAAPPA